MVKKIVASALTFLLFFSAVVGCSKTKEENNENKDLGASNKQVEKFASHILENEYADAIALYNSEISGNSKLEVEAASCMELYLSDIQSGILSGEYDSAAAEIKENTVKKVYSSTNCKPKNYDDLIAGIDAAFQSKVAYKSGLSFFESQNYPEAIAEFTKVLPEDSDYLAAMEKYDASMGNYKKEIQASAEETASGGDLFGAVKIYQQAAEILPDDSDLLAWLNTAEKNYLSGVTAQAESVFTDYSKYQEALAIILTALQNYPDDATLLTKKEYYSSFEPVNLYDMDKLKGDADYFNTDEDIYGNSYEKCFFAGYNSMIWNETDITYHLNYAYNAFSATVYCRSTKNEAQSMKVEIYADGKIIYQNLNVPDNATPPLDINLDITGVSELRIVLDRNKGAIGRGIGMTNMILQKTVK